MYKTQAKIDNLSTAEWQQYHQLLSNRRVVEYFRFEIERFAHTALKPDDVLRRFSLNGDGQLDVKEFSLALKRLGILALPAASDSAAQQQQLSDALMKARELYSAFCPSQTKKLDIDMFCRIMTEWSMQLLRARRDQQQQQQQQQQTHRPSSTSTHNNNVQPSYTSYDQYASGTGIAAPYATEHSRRRGDFSAGTDNTASGGIPPSLHNSSSGHNSESDAIWRRISDAIAHNMDKLRQLYFKMDVLCAGSVSRDEFELGLSHIGVFLTPREYERVYESLSPELKDYRSSNHSDAFAIKYADFLALFHNQSPLALPSTSKQTSPPVAGVGTARLWDALVQALDRFAPLVAQLERVGQRYVSPDVFRDVLARCGLALSNADYAALRVRLLPFTDSSTGAIGLTLLLQALQASDNSASKTLTTSSPITNVRPPSARSGNDTSPIRTGRRTNFQAAHESYNPQQQQQPSLYQSNATQHAAGKSNEQRNVEANRTSVKIRDESRWKSDATLYGNPADAAARGATSLTDASTATARAAFPKASYDAVQHDDPMFASRPVVALERRILRQLQQLKALGQLASASPQSIFPGDRFGRITRGQFRQSLVHLSVLARYAEVESLFWLLDPTGRGYIVAHDLYDHLQAFAATPDDAADAPPSPRSSGLFDAPVTHDGATLWNTLPAVADDASQAQTQSPAPHSRPDLRISDSPSSNSRCGARRLPRSAQKVLERMLLELPTLLAACQRVDTSQTGRIAPQELLTATQTIGILASTEDLQSAIFTIYSGDATDVTRPSDGRPPTMPYRHLETRLGQLCSDLLSPKKRKMHLSTTSVLLAPHEQSYDEQLNSGGAQTYDMHTVAETDALWNCPRRRMNQDHRATKTTFRIADHVSDDVGLVQTRLAQSVPKALPSQSRSQSQQTPSSQQAQLRKNRLAVISLLHDLLEHRIDFKTAVDMHHNADVHGHVSRKDLADILLTSRLGLNFASASVSSSGTSIDVRDFVEMLYPSDAPPHTAITYIDVLHRATELLADLKRVTPATAPGYQHSNSSQTQRQTARRLNSNIALGAVASPSTSSRRNFAPCTSGSSLSNDEAAVRRKLLQESRLRDMLTSTSGQQSAAILIRHAFKGLAPREMVVSIDGGEFEATCRASDLKHVCYRLGLDLDLSEQQYIALAIDKVGSGFISSPQLLEFFTQLALSAELSASSTPELSKRSQFPGFSGNSQLDTRAAAGVESGGSYNPIYSNGANGSGYAPLYQPDQLYQSQQQQQQGLAREAWNNVQAG